MVNSSLVWLVALLLSAGMIQACARPIDADTASDPIAESEQGTVVATVAQTEPSDALRLYLHGWMLRYNQRASEEMPNASEATWTPEKPDDFVSVAPVVSMSDFRTVTVWSATISPLGTASENHAAYRADFTFWRGNPASSAGRGATPLSSSATYETSWDVGRSEWVITQTSESPEKGIRREAEAQSR